MSNTCTPTTRIEESKGRSLRLADGKWLAICLFALLASSCVETGNWVEATLEARRMCATYGIQRCVVLRSDEPMVVDISGPVNQSMVEVGPDPVDVCWCQCMCASGRDLGDVVVTRSDRA